MADQKPTILLIDDDKMIADAMGRALSLAGYEVIHAYSGKAGLKDATDNQPNLIILDYTMPGMDGLTVLEALRKDLWGHSAKVIFATNVYDIEVVNAVMKLGVTDYIMKSDLAIDELIRLVGKYVPLKNTANEDDEAAAA